MQPPAANIVARQSPAAPGVERAEANAATAAAPARMVGEPGAAPFHRENSLLGACNCRRNRVLTSNLKTTKCAKEEKTLSRICIGQHKRVLVAVVALRILFTTSQQGTHYICSRLVSPTL